LSLGSDNPDAQAGGNNMAIDFCIEALRKRGRDLFQPGLARYSRSSRKRKARRQSVGPKAKKQKDGQKTMGARTIGSGASGNISFFFFVNPSRIGLFDRGARNSCRDKPIGGPAGGLRRVLLRSNIALRFDGSCEIKVADVSRRAVWTLQLLF
jgi:hypothetical protein